MTYRTEKVLASLIAVLVITLGFNSAYAEELSAEALENKVQNIITVKDNVEKLTSKLSELELRLDNARLSGQYEKVIVLGEQLEKLNDIANKEMAKFVELTTDKNGQVNFGLLQHVTNGGTTVIASPSNYKTEFWQSPTCTHVGTFPNPCSGSDYATSEFSWTAPINPLNVYGCSAGICVSVGWSTHAPFTWTQTPVDLYFDKKKTYGIDFVTGQTTNTLTLYGTDTVDWWNYTPVNHDSLKWIIHYYDSGSNSKVIWVSAHPSLGFNAN